MVSRWFVDEVQHVNLLDKRQEHRIGTLLDSLP